MQRNGNTVLNTLLNTYNEFIAYVYVRITVKCNHHLPSTLFIHAGLLSTASHRAHSYSVDTVHVAISCTGIWLRVPCEEIALFSRIPSRKDIYGTFPIASLERM